MNRLLHARGYSLPGNRKTLEGRQHPDRDAQFQHLSQRVAAFQQAGQPVVSVDAQKKELVDPFKKGGRKASLRKSTCLIAGTRKRAK